MAKHMKSVTVPATEAHTKDVVDYVSCDLCHRQSKTGDYRFGETDWNPENYHHDKVAVHREEGCNYPEIGNSTYTIFDICPDCFLNKLLPWLQEQGACPRTEETDW